MGASNTVEINGKLYDARTGRPIGSAENNIVKNALKKRQRATTKSVEGIRPAKNNPSATKKAIPVTASDTSTKQQRPSPRNAMKRRPKQSVTLHRGAVHQPSITTTAAAPAKIQSSALKAVHDPAYDRAKKVKKSPLVSRFGQTDTPKAVEKKTSTKPVTPSQKEVGSTAKKEHFVQTALAHAASEKTPQPTKRAKKQSRKGLRVTGIGSAIMAACLVAAYVAYLNIPSISMRVAAHQAGFSATLPGYRPTGYSFSGPIEYHPGQVTINFRAADPTKTFSLSQQETTWDSTALLENYIAKNTAQYVTYQDRGLTIYIYDGSNAAWVNGGKMYTVDGKNTQLDTDQILKLATSM